MATHRIVILGWPAKPDNSGDVFPEPFSIKATNGVFDRLVLIFNDTATRIGIPGGFTVPKNYVAGATLIAVWTSSAIAGNFIADFDYRAIGGDDAESLDQTGNQESVTVTDVAPSAAFERMEVSVALTDGNFAADDEVEFEFFRDGAAEGGGGIAAAVMCFQLLFGYTD